MGLGKALVGYQPQVLEGGAKGGAGGVPDGEQSSAAVDAGEGGLAAKQLPEGGRQRGRDGRGRSRRDNLLEVIAKFLQFQLEAQQKFFNCWRFDYSVVVFFKAWQYSTETRL